MKPWKLLTILLAACVLDLRAQELLERRQACGTMKDCIKNLKL